MGRHVGAGGRRAARPLPARAGRQQRHHRRRTMPTSISPCAPSPSVPWAPLASAALTPAGCSCTSVIAEDVHRSGWWRPMTSSHRAIRSIPSTLMGPLIDEVCDRGHEAALKTAQAEGARVLTGGKRVDRPGLLREADHRQGREARHARSPARRPSRPSSTSSNYEELEDAIAMQQRRPAGSVPRDVHHQLAAPRRRFLAREGSDCGIANINIGTSRRRDRGRLRRREGDRRRTRGRQR